MVLGLRGKKIKKKLMLLVCKKYSFIGHKLIIETRNGSDLKGVVHNLKRFETA